MNKSVRTRFAPSPTGLLHIGGVRTALFAYLFAKANNGTFVLRLEDTDRERFVPEGVEQIIQSLDWLGLHPDEGEWYGEHIGEYGPYRQSLRLESFNPYKEWMEWLTLKEFAYKSYTSPEKLASLREEAKQRKVPFVYRRYMEPHSDDIPLKGEFPIRLDIEAIRKHYSGDQELHQRVDWDDMVRGKFSDALANMDDFIIMKADGYPTYNFANVVDDHLMQITHVIRGDEFISTTGKHVLLYKILDWEVPKFIHLPAILGPDGKKKLSKRDGDVDVLEYKAKGYLPEALTNFLALLGWNDGTTQEKFSLKQLIDCFSIDNLPDKIQKSPARFDLDRLNWMNGEYLREMSSDDLLEKLKAFLPEEWYKDTNYLKQVLALDKERIKTLAEAQYVMEIFFTKPKVDKAMLTKKDSMADIQVWLQEASKVLQISEFEHDTLEQAMRALAEKLNIKTGQLFYALRISLTGRTEAPGLFDIMLTLGKEETLQRINNIST